MLTHLQIRDLAIVDAAEIEFRGGLTVLTGETGAGKSIVVDALQLIAGGRAGTEVVRHGAERAEASATFDLRKADEAVARLLKEQSIEDGDELTIRRVITADGRSRAYLNGQAVPLQVLRAVGDLLIDIHGQHEFQSLGRAAAQRELLDAHAGLQALTAEVGGLQRVWITLLNRTLDLESRARDREARLDLLRYQAKELAALELKTDEITALIEERSRLANSGKLVESAQAAAAFLYEAEESNAHAFASRALAAIRSVATVDPKLGAVAPLIDEALINLREASRELSHYLEGLDLDTNRQAEVERRLAAIEELARKHRVTPSDLLARSTQIEQELAELERADIQLTSLRNEQQEALAAYRTRAGQLSAKRITAGKALSKVITQRMQTLGMAGGRFQIEISPLETVEPAPHGIDQIEFRVTANPGQPLRALSKVASGGELSRLSLAVQVSQAAADDRCMVFDEVDSGVGGAVAEIVGRELRALGERGQALCVTHLPQVASQGHQQLRVSKLTDGKATRTTIASLGPDERVEEIARMLGGIEITEKARDHAREMLGFSRRTARAPATTIKNK